MSYKNYISEENLASMEEFVGPMLEIVVCEPSDSDKALEGIQLYSRQVVSHTTIAALQPIIELIQSNLFDEDIVQKVREYIDLTVKTAADNIDLTTGHLREYCEDNNIDFDKTPYV